MHNFIEALKDARELTAREKTLYTQGLVSVLKDLHDELDATVLAAYGLDANISNDALLTHLVALNAQRAEEEKTGKVRWLRPEFQNLVLKLAPGLLSKQELLAPVFLGLQNDLIPKNDPKPAKSGKKGAPVLPHAFAQNPWPSTLPA